MVLLEIENAIRARVRAQLTDGGDGGNSIATRFPNDPGADPSSGPWIRLTIRHGGRDQRDFGGNSVRSRSSGVAFLECFDSDRKGTATIHAVADRVIAALQRVRANPVQFETPYILGAAENEGAWFRVVVAAPWFADDFA